MRRFSCLTFILSLLFAGHAGAFAIPPVEPETLSYSNTNYFLPSSSPNVMPCPPNLMGFGRSNYQMNNDLITMRHIPGHVRSQGLGSDFLVTKAMNQISCPTRNLGKGAGQCSGNGYRGSTYDCAFYVRTALAGTVLPGNIGGLGNAKDMGCNLQKHGLKNLCGMNCGSGAPTCNMNPLSAPPGAVLVYDNVGSACHPAGHAEIRTNTGFVSDYFSPRPRNSGNNCRRLIGVWVK